jgi:hypothetical protein
MNQEEHVPQARPPAAPWTLKKLQFRSSNAWEFAESSGNLPAMASSLGGLGKAAATQRWQVNLRGDMRE